MLVFILMSCNKNVLVENDDLNLNSWTKQANIPNEYLRMNADVFTYNNEAYLLTGKGGTRFSSKPEILKYKDYEWTQVTTYDGFASAGSSRNIRNNDIIYILGGVNGSNAPTDEVRAFSITDHTFSRESRLLPAAKATYTETKAYFLNGEELSSFNFNSKIREDLPEIPTSQSISSASIFAQNNTVYVLLTFLEIGNFFAFDEPSKNWSQLSDFPGGTRSGASIVSTETNIYAGLGEDQIDLFDVWRYNVETNQWIEFVEYPGKHFSSGFAFELGDELFFGGGFTGDGAISNDSLNEELYSIKVN